MKWIFNEDLSKDPAKVYKETLEFLGLPCDGRKNFERANIYQKKRSFLLIKFWKMWAPFLRPPMLALKKLFKIQRLGIKDSLDDWNTVAGPKKPLSPEMRALLVEEFREEVEKLSRIINHDLSHWHQ